MKTLLQSVIQHVWFNINVQALFQVCEYAPSTLTLMHSERPKLNTILAFLSAIGLNQALPEGNLQQNSWCQQGKHFSPTKCT